MAVERLAKKQVGADAGIDAEISENDAWISGALIDPVSQGHGLIGRGLECVRLLAGRARRRGEQTCRQKKSIAYGHEYSRFVINPTQCPMASCAEFLVVRQA